MDYKQAYEKALERAKSGKPMDEVFPELKESEDERLRKLLVWQVYRNIEDETNDLASSVYDGIKGHDPDLEESIEDWKKCLAYLEKQKEQKPAEWSDSVAKEMFIKALERAVEQTKKGYELTDCDKHSWWEDFKAYSGIKPAEWSEEDEERLINTSISFLKDFADKGYENAVECIDWLKSKL